MCFADQARFYYINNQGMEQMETKNPLVGLGDFLQKAVDGFEPTIKLLQSRALPLGYTAVTYNIVT